VSIVTVGESPLQSNGNLLEYKKLSRPIADIGELTHRHKADRQRSKSLAYAAFRAGQVHYRVRPPRRVQFEIAPQHVRERLSDRQDTTCATPKGKC
jgi:hypothetical protein